MLKDSHLHFYVALVSLGILIAAGWPPSDLLPLNPEYVTVFWGVLTYSLVDHVIKRGMFLRLPFLLLAGATLYIAGPVFVAHGGRWEELRIGLVAGMAFNVYMNFMMWIVCLVKER